MTTRFEVEPGELTEENIELGPGTSFDKTTQPGTLAVVLKDDRKIKITTADGEEYAIVDASTSSSHATVFQNAPSRRHLFSVSRKSVDRLDQQPGRRLSGRRNNLLGRIIFEGPSGIR